MKLLLIGVAALFLATGAAHAREVHDKGIKRECQIKLNDEQTKIANFDEIKTCIKGF